LRQPTTPKIFVAENTDDSRRLVAAQARMYSDAKAVFFGRISVVSALSLAAMITTASWPASRLVLGGGGGLLLFVGSFLAESIEKRRRLEAAATQELFDTRVFQLEWNSLHASRPSSAAIAQAAKRYEGGRDKDWYDDTEDTHRPFDVLICQATNLGWGATMHRLWVWILVAASILLIGLMGLVWHILQFTFDAALLTLLVPALAPFKEVANLVKLNLENAHTKESTERTVNELWETGMTAGTVPSESQLRSLQDKILVLRQTNSYVPDWLDSVFHRRNEATMRASVADRVAQAKRSEHG